MSSYALLAKLSNIETATSDLEASIGALNTNKQNKLTAAPLPTNNTTATSILNGTTIKRIDKTAPITLANNDQQNVITLGLDTSNIQSKLNASQIPANHVNTTKAILSGSKVMSLRGEQGVLIEAILII